MLSDADLAGMVGTLSASLPDLCSIDHVTQVPDGSGGHTPTVVTSEGVRCRYAPTTDKRGGENIVAESIAAFSGWIFTFDAGTEISELDKIRPDAGGTFEVEAVFGRTWEIDRRVFCREIK